MQVITVDTPTGSESEGVESIDPNKPPPKKSSMTQLVDTHTESESEGVESIGPGKSSPKKGSMTQLMEKADRVLDQLRKVHTIHFYRVGQLQDGGAVE